MSEFVVRPATTVDATLLHSLARACPPLDLHTHYTYWVQATFFGDGCYIAETVGRPVGFITSVTAGERQLVWQIGILSEFRGRRLSELLIDAVVRAARTDGRGEVEVSIAPENDISLAAFSGYARNHGLQLKAVGEVDLTDPMDPEFREFEKLYVMSLGAAAN